NGCFKVIFVVLYCLVINLSSKKKPTTTLPSSCFHPYTLFASEPMLLSESGRAIIVAIACWFILEKTTFGYELKACGYNKEASRYAGINANRNIVLSMIIAGGLSGLGGGLYYLAGTIQYVLEKKTLAMGFNGIPVALLANSNPIGTIFSSLFISYIQVGGSAMQPNFSSESTDIIIAVIIYLAAFALLMKGVITGILKKTMKSGDDKEAKA
ncbi:MAG: ABC transporter permease, partial [Lachnospiraceae bacterium]|nr:ABC transporter permease [Lachnospiraceae bacterium]